ncbi:MAG: glycosyltransferase family 2 protein [Akkermansiaceae bacterium]
MKQKIYLYTICWNEEFMLPYFFRYYDQFVDQYIFYDDGSTDRSLEILGNHPKVEVRQLIRNDDPEKDSYVLAAKAVHESCWKEAIGKVDWVIITAIDEFLYHPDLSSYLLESSKNDITAIPALGYQMISNERPTSNEQIFDVIKRGCPWDRMNKLSIFNPNKIVSTNQQNGRHFAKPEGDVKYPNRDELLNLHFKYLNFDETFKRHQELNEKLGSVDKENNWGVKYNWEKEKFENSWNRFMRKSSKNIFSRLYKFTNKHSNIKKRWWRK